MASTARSTSAAVDIPVESRRAHFLVAAYFNREMFVSIGEGIFRTAGLNANIKSTDLMSQTDAKNLQIVLSSMLEDLCVIVVAEFQTALKLTVSCAERAGPLLTKLVSGIHKLYRPLLKLDGVAARTCRDLDQSFRQVNLSVVVNTDLGNYIAVAKVAPGSTRKCFR